MINFNLYSAWATNIAANKTASQVVSMETNNILLKNGYQLINEAV